MTGIRDFIENSAEGQTFFSRSYPLYAKEFNLSRGASETSSLFFFLDLFLILRFFTNSSRTHAEPFRCLGDEFRIGRPISHRGGKPSQRRPITLAASAGEGLADGMTDGPLHT